MGNSKAYPVLRTTDATMAYTQATRLCELMAERDDEVGLGAELQTVADVRHMAEVLPAANFDYLEMRTGPAGEHVWFDLDVTTTDDATLERHLPLDIMEDVPRGNVEERFVRALGRGMAAIEWHGVWPHEPEAGHYGSTKYDGVQVVFHGEEAQWSEWTEHHTVFVHLGGRDPVRARKLAAHIGSEVLGEPQLGW